MRTRQTGKVCYSAVPERVCRHSQGCNVIGLYDRFEIWSEDEYERYKPDGEALVNFAAELGF